MRSLPNRGLLALFIIILTSCVAGCSKSETPTSQRQTEAATGISFNLQWPNARDVAAQNYGAQAIDPDACNAYSIETVRATVRSSNRNVAISVQFTCRQHSGTINDVPSGEAYQLTIEADGYNGVRWVGGVSDLSVQKGRTTEAGLIQLAAQNDDEAPIVSMVAPPDGATDVPINTSLTITFSERVITGSISEENFVLGMVDGDQFIQTHDIAVSYDPQTFTATLTGAANLEEYADYRAMILSGPELSVQDMAGNKLAPYEWSFRTSTWVDMTAPRILSVSPADGANGVLLDTSVRIVFDEPLLASGITADNVQLRLLDQPIEGNISYIPENDSIIFTPDAPLVPGARYTTALSADICDTSRNPLENSFTASFVTVPGAPELVAPQNDTTVFSTGVSLEWAAASGLNNSYQLEISDTATFSEKSLFFLDTTQHYLPETPLGLNYWRVRAVDEFGNPGAWSGIWHFLGDRTIWLEQRGNEECYGKAVAAMNDGTVLVGGEMKGTMDGYTVENYRDLFFLSLNSDGQYLRTQVINGYEEQFLEAMVVDGNENIYATGFTYLGFMGSSFWGLTCAFLVKYHDQSLSYVKAYGADYASTSGSGLLLADDGSVFISGYTEGDLETHEDTDTDRIFISKTTALGALSPPILYQPINDIAYQAHTSSAMDSAGNLYTVTSTPGNIDGQVNSGDTDICLVSWTAGGQKRWTRLYGGSGADDAGAMIIDPDDRIYICGSTASNWDHYSPGSLNAGQSDICVLQVDTGGNLNWIRLIGSSSSDAATAVTRDGAGNLYITGYTYGSLQGYSHQGDADIIVAKISPEDGNLIWLEGLGSAQWDMGNALCVDRNDDIIVTGGSRGRLTDLTPSGGFFVWKMTGRDK